MDTRIRIRFPVFSLVKLAERRVVVKPLENGECYVVLFTVRAEAEEWRARECPFADLWTMRDRDNLRKFLIGTVSDRTCRVAVNPSDSATGPPCTVAIRGLLERLTKK